MILNDIEWYEYDRYVWNILVVPIKIVNSQ